MRKLQTSAYDNEIPITVFHNGNRIEPVRDLTIAVVIPAYNEEATIAHVLDDFARELPHAELIVVDNASTDDTRHVATAALQRLTCAGRLIQELQRGKGHAIRRAFAEADADIVVMVDADSTYPASDVHRLIAPIMGGQADMVVGDRQAGGRYQRENKRPFHGSGNALVRSTINWLFHAELNDVLSGFRAFSRTFIENFPVMSGGFEIETEITLHALDKRFRVKELPIAYRDRPQGSVSKLSTFSDGLRVIRTILNIFRWYRPMGFFGSLAALFSLGSLLVGSQVIVEYVLYRYVYKVPSAILATGLMLLAVLCVSLGLMLDTVVRLHHVDFALRLNYRKK
jgi:glycosyltransferase involved in cell wall biosynthesis